VRALSAEDRKRRGEVSIDLVRKKHPIADAKKYKHGEREMSKKEQASSELNP
jgi:hypothetical protein